ncbi:MAG: HD domain-containing protein [Bdellovibrionales bacterium]|nr:HD domain-containing protein [Bdellovibrionales bacterium]
MASITFADVVHQSINFSREIPSESLVLDLIDTAWVQRLRDISQTANTRLVYMFSEHSRFGHSLGVAHLANLLMQRLAQDCLEKVKPYREAVSAAALLHDVGHLAPGSHTAYKTWFPEQADQHEKIAIRIISEDPELQKVLGSHGDALSETICRIIREDSELPSWTWEIISGGGWNVDRGNWCIVDSILAGVSYGKYNIPALTDSIVISDNDHLALRENRLDAMMHFAVSRHAMYKQMYQHRVLLAADVLNSAIAKRARAITDKIDFADATMRKVLEANQVGELSITDYFNMREPWWRYHLMRWSNDRDSILADLCSRLLNRNLLKTVRVSSDDQYESLLRQARESVSECGYDPDYYLHTVKTGNMQSGDSHQSMHVLMEDGRLSPVSNADPLFHALLNETRTKNVWLVMPAEAKGKLGRTR